MGKYLDKVEAMGHVGQLRMKTDKPRDWRNLLLEARRERGREDFWYFATEILKNPVLYHPLHGPLCEWVQPENWKKANKLCIIPRGHIKTSLLSAAHICWLLVGDPNLRILVTSHKIDDAKLVLHYVKDYLGSELIRDVYPEIRPAGNQKKPTKWSDGALRLQRTKTFKEHTVEASSVGASVTGRHYNYIFFEDIVTFESVQQPELIQRTKDYHIYCDALLEPDGRKMMNGTRYDYADEYGRIIDTPVLAAEWDIVVLPAIRKRGAECPCTNRTALKIWYATPEDQPIYPTRFTIAEDDEPGKKSLPKLKRTTSSFFYASQYENDPVDPEHALFKEEQIKFIRELPKDRQYTCFRVCDLSGETMTESYTAIVTGMVDQFANIYITDVFWGQYSSGEIVTELIEGQRRPSWTPAECVGFEPAPFERTLKATLEQRMGEEQVVVPYSFLDPAQAQKAKDDRIKGISWWFESGKFHIVHGCRHSELLVDEFLKWPRYSRKDIADACAQIPHIMWPAGTPVEEADAKRNDPIHKEIRELMGSEDRDYIGNQNVMDRDISVLAAFG